MYNKNTLLRAMSYFRVTGVNLGANSVFDFSEDLEKSNNIDRSFLVMPVEELLNFLISHFLELILKNIVPKNDIKKLTKFIDEDYPGFLKDVILRFISEINFLDSRNIHEAVKILNDYLSIRPNLKQIKYAGINIDEKELKIQSIQLNFITDYDPLLSKEDVNKQILANLETFKLDDKKISQIIELEIDINELVQNLSDSKIEKNLNTILYYHPDISIIKRIDCDCIEKNIVEILKSCKNSNNILTYLSGYSENYDIFSKISFAKICLYLIDVGFSHLEIYNIIKKDRDCLGIMIYTLATKGININELIDSFLADNAIKAVCTWYKIEERKMSSGLYNFIDFCFDQPTGVVDIDRLYLMSRETVVIENEDRFLESGLSERLIIKHLDILNDNQIINFIKKLKITESLAIKLIFSGYENQILPLIGYILKKAEVDDVNLFISRNNIPLHKIINPEIQRSKTFKIIQELKLSSKNTALALSYDSDNINWTIKNIPKFINYPDLKIDEIISDPVFLKKVLHDKKITSKANFVQICKNSNIDLSLMLKYISSDLSLIALYIEFFENFDFEKTIFSRDDIKKNFKIIMNNINKARPEIRAKLLNWMLYKLDKEFIAQNLEVISRLAKINRAWLLGGLDKIAIRAYYDSIQKYTIKTPL